MGRALDSKREKCMRFRVISAEKCEYESATALGYCMYVRRYGWNVDYPCTVYRTLILVLQYTHDHCAAAGCAEPERRNKAQESLLILGPSPFLYKYYTTAAY